MMFLFGIHLFGPMAHVLSKHRGTSLHSFIKARAATALSIAEGPGGDLLHAAVACGYCLLLAGEPSSPAFPDRLALPAAQRLAEFIESAIADVNELTSRWDDASPNKADDLVTVLLWKRMDSWACMETLAAAAGSAELVAALEDCEERLSRFDLALVSNIDFLATLAETHLLRDWRLSLAEPYRDSLPWYLDGSLEAAVVDVERSISAMEQSLLEAQKSGTPADAFSEASRAHIMRALDSAVEPTHMESVCHPLMGWGSPDGRYFAQLYAVEDGPPTNGPRLFAEFMTRFGAADPKSLAGRVAVLDNFGVPIEWRRIDRRTAVVADIPMAAVRQALKNTAWSPRLVVMPDRGVWAPWIPSRYAI